MKLININTLIRNCLCFNVLILQVFSLKIKQLLDEDLTVIPGYIPSLETAERLSIENSPNNSFYTKKMNGNKSNMINKYDDVPTSSENGNYNAFSNEWGKNIKKNLYNEINPINPLFDPYNTKIQERYQSFDELHGIINDSKDVLVNDNIIGINSANGRIKTKNLEDNPMIINKNMFDLNVSSIKNGLYNSKWYDKLGNLYKNNIEVNNSNNFNNNGNGVYYNANKLKINSENSLLNNSKRINLKTNTNINLDNIYRNSNPRFIVSFIKL